MNQEIIDKMNTFKRNDFGLIESKEYKLNEDGSINWRAMIEPKYLYINKEFFTRKNKPIPTSIEGLEDNQLLISLAGLKELAKIRGFTSKRFDLSGYEGYSVARCQVQWLPNYETSFESVLTEDFANAYSENTDSFCLKFLETISCNRAFVRCVRNFLNIHIVGVDEIDKSESEDVIGKAPIDNMAFLKPSGLLEKTSKESGHNSFDEFKEFLRVCWKDESYKNEDAKDWKSFSDIPAKDCRTLTKLLKKD